MRTFVIDQVLLTHWPVTLCNYFVFCVVQPWCRLRLAYARRKEGFHSFSPLRLQHCDKSKTEALEDDEIEEFYKILTERKEIDSIFQMYSNPEGFMSCQNLVRFLYEMQQEEDAVVAAPALIQRYEPNERGRLKTLAGLLQNLAFLMNYEFRCCCFFLQSCVLFSPHSCFYNTALLGEHQQLKERLGNLSLQVFFWVHWQERG